MVDVLVRLRARDPAIIAMTLNGRGLKADSTLRIVSMVAVMELVCFNWRRKSSALKFTMARWFATTWEMPLSRTSSRANRIAGGYPRE